jgi:hypothetical protein
MHALAGIYNAVAYVTSDVGHNITGVYSLALVHADAGVSAGVAPTVAGVLAT